MGKLQSKGTNKERQRERPKNLATGERRETRNNVEEDETMIYEIKLFKIAEERTVTLRRTSTRNENVAG